MDNYSTKAKTPTQSGMKRYNNRAKPCTVQYTAKRAQNGRENCGLLPADIYFKKIKEGEYNLIIRKNSQVIFKSNDSGLKGLVLAAKKGFLKEAIIYDKTIGLVAAKIAVFFKAKELYALLASKLALIFCQTQKVPLKAEKIVEKIYDFKHKNECYLEKTAQKTDNVSDLMKILGNLYEI